MRRVAAVGVVIASSLVFGATESAQGYETPGTATAWALAAGGASVSSTFASGLSVTASLSNLRAAGLVTLGSNDTLSAGATSAMFTPAMPTATQAFTFSAFQTTAFNDCDGQPNGTTPATGTGAGIQVCTNMAQLTVNFSEPVTNPVFHFAGFGGSASTTNTTTGALRYSEILTAQLSLTGSSPGGAVLGAPSTGAVNLQSGTGIRAIDLKASPACNSFSAPSTAVAGCGSVPVKGTVTSLTFTVELDQQIVFNDGIGLTNRTTMPSDLVRVSISVPQDFSDAPASYNGTVAPAHDIGDLKLGSTVDEDFATTPNSTVGNPSVSADADDNAGDDEEAVSIFPPLSAAAVGQTYTLPVALSGASKPARVCGWIDFNINGVFDNPSEQACQSVAAGATTTSLSWTIPSGTVAGASYARIRTAYVAAQAESPTGGAASGEVEDYAVTISSAYFRLAKVTNGDVGSFTFSTTNLKASPIVVATTTIGTAVVSPVVDVVAATTPITVTEAVPAGWTLAAVSCTDARGAVTGNGAATFGTVAGNVVTVPAANVKIGSDITCTVTNDKTPAVSIAKTSVGGTGTFSFATTNTATTPVGVTTSAAGSPTTSSPAAVTNRANPVTITETVPAGWRLTGASCVDRRGAISGNGTGAFATLAGSTLTIAPANLKPGADIVCTVTNDLPATLRVTKQAIGGGGSFPFTVSGGATSSFTLNPNPPVTPQATQVIAPVTAGTPTKISESGTNSKGYTLVDISCIDQAGSPAGSTVGTPSLLNTAVEMGNVTVGLVPAADVNCVFTNIKNADIALIKVSKGGDVAVPFTVNYDTGESIIAPTITTVGGVGTSAFSVKFDKLVTSRTIDIAETIPAGYVLTAVECTAQTGSITVTSSDLATGRARAAVTPGTTGSCKFTNEKRPTVTIRKQTTNGVGAFSFSGGTNGLGPTFTLDTTPANPASSAVFQLTAPNTATSITETLPADWKLTGVSCVNPAGAVVSAASWLVGGTLTIPAASLGGGANITCTYTNDKLLPKIDVAKTAGTLTGPDGAGNFSIGYTITVVNSGLGSGTYGPLTDTSSPTSGVQITSTTWSTSGAGAPAGGSSATTGPYTLASAGTVVGPGVTQTYSLTQTFRYTAVPGAAACAGPGTGLYNAVALPAGAETDTTNNAACVNAPARPTPALTTTKSLAAGSITSYKAVGEVISYTITVKNAGNLDFKPLAVSDPKADVGTLSCPAVSLAVGASMTCTAKHTVTQADLDAGAVRNIASATGTTADGTTATTPSAEVVVPAVQSPSLAVVKATKAVDFRTVGEVISYSINVRNSGNVTLADVSLADPTADAGSVACPSFTLAPGASMDCTATRTTTQADLDAGSITNVATATGTPPGGKPITGSSGKVVVPAKLAPAVVTTKSSPTVNYAKVGDVINYSITVQNTGNVTLTSVNVTDPKADAAPVCSPLSLAPGASASCPAKHTVTQADLDGGSVTNTATGAAATSTGVIVTDPSDPVVVPALVNAAVETIKALASGSITSYKAPGDVIGYVITVKNIGNVTLSGVNVADPKADAPPACAATVLAPGASTTCLANHTVTQADLDAGSVVNVATTTAKSPKGAAVTDPSDPVTVPAIGSPTLLTTKSSPTPNFSKVGEVITYAITVKNTGNVTLKGLAVSDPKADAAPTCASGVLAPGATTTCSAKHTVTQADLDAGAVDNIATASAITPTGATVTDPSDQVTVPAVQSTAIVTTKALEKSSITAYSAVGDVIRYTITVSNTGNVSLKGVAASDPLADTPPTCAATTLAPGASTTCAAAHTVTQADLDRGSVDNVATGVGIPPSGVAITDPSDTVSVPATARPAMSVKKTTSQGSITEYSKPGEVIEYTITIINTGNVTLADVAVSDPVADVGSISCPQTKLAPATSQDCSARHTITQADLDAGSVVNIAEASATPPTGAPVATQSNEVTVPAVAKPEIQTTKTTSSTTYAAVGDLLDYQITVSNVGNVTIDKVEVADPNADAAPSCDATTLAPGESTKCTATHTVTQADIDAGSVTNTATGSGVAPNGEPVSSPSDPVVVTGAQSPAVTTSKVLDPASITTYVAVGDVIRYTISVVNSGNVTVDNVVINDANADATPSCAPSSLAPGEAATCPAAHTVTQADLDAGSVTNTAIGSADAPGGLSPSDASDPVVVNAAQTPSVTTTKALDPASITSYRAVGDVIKYLITVRNTGNVSLTGVAASDPKADAAPVCLPTALLPGEVSTCAAVHTVTQADLDAGSVSNTATGSGTPPSGPPVTDPSDPVVTPGVSTPSISAVKSSPNVNVSAVGEVISYQITIKNTGNVSLTGVAASDPKADAAPVCAATTLAPGESTTCAATHTVTQADLDAGSVVNVAAASGQPPTGAPVSSPSNQVTVPVVQQTALLTTKTLDPTSITTYSAVGNVIRYAITVKNNGNVTVNSVAVVDPRADATPICAPTSLAPGASAQCRAAHTVTQADLDAGKVTNVATGSATPIGGAPITDVSGPVVVPATQTPSLVATKSLNPASVTSYATVGTVIRYDITVANTGNVSLAGVAVTDPLADAGSIICDVDGLAPAATTTCSATHTVTQADLDRGSVVNTAAASAIPPTGAAVTASTSPVTVPAVPTPSVLTTKATTTTDFRAAGDVIDYDITVTNTGNVTLNDINVVDPVADSTPTCTPTTLAPGATASCPAKHTVTAADLDRGFVVNVATGGGTAPDGTPALDPSDQVSVPAVQLPAMSVAKSLDGASISSFDAPGQVIDYVILVRNTGNVTLTGVAVTDANADAGSITCDVATIAVGAVATCAARHTVTQADLDRTSVVNTATASGTPPSGVAITTPSNEVVVPGLPKPALATVKSTPVVGYSTVGSTISYSIVVTNSGNMTMTGIAVADPKADAGSITCDATTLAPGAAATCSATHTVVQADLDGGSVVNTATASGNAPTGTTVDQPSNPVTVPAVPQPSVLTAKSTATTSYDSVGDPIDYTITVQNTGNVTLTGVGIDDPNADAGSIVCAPTALAPGATATCSATHTATQADLDTGFVVNTATGSGTPPTGPAVIDPSNEVRVDGTKISGLETIKTTTTVDYDQVGDVIDYDITVRNAGNVTVTNLALTDPVADAGSIVCDLTVLAPGATATCTAKHTVTQADLDAGVVTNTATGAGQEPGGVPVTDASNEVQVPAVVTRMLDTTKSSPTVSVKAVGDVIGYVITVKNTGNVTMSAVSVTDPVADVGSLTCDVAVLAPTATATCSASHTVTQADLDAGKVVNVATTAGTPPIGPTITDPSNEITVPVVQTPSLQTVKATTATAFSQPGQVIDYTIVVTNTGNVTITNVTVADPKADAVPTCDTVALAQGAVANCTAQHTVTQADIDAGEVLNTATASGMPPSGPAVTDPSDQVRVAATQTPAVVTAKASTTTNFAAVGDVIRYSITVTNTGNVTMRNVAVADPVADAGSVSCTPTTLAPDEVADCSAAHTVTQADIDAGRVINTATATADDPTGTSATAPSNEVTVPAVQIPGLLTGKVLAAGSPTQVSAVGEVIDYVISLRNTGNVTLNPVAAADPNADATPVCLVATLAPGGSTTCAASHTVTQADLDRGEILNVATGTGTPPTGAPVVTPSPQVTVPVEQTAAVTTTKALASGSITSYTTPGDVIDYLITVTNSGNVTLTTVAATDPLADAVPVCAPTTLAPGAASICSAAHTVTQADIDRGSVINTAVGSGMPPTGPAVNDPSDPVTVPAVQTATLVTTKTSNTPDFDAVGDAISYSITVANTGNVTLTNVAVADPNADAAPSCAPSTLAPGATANCTAIHTVTQADLDAGEVLNTARGTASGPAGGEIADSSDQVGVPGVVTPAVLTIKSSPTPTYTAVDEKIDYVVTVQNTGNVTITGVAVTDPQADAAPVCSPTDLAPGATANCPATHTVTQADLDAGRVPNTAAGAGFAPDGSLIADASNEVIVPATKVSGIEVTKTSPTTNFDQVGDVLDYVITVRNAGNVTLTGVTVADAVADPGSITCVPTTLAPGASSTCSATHTVTQADLDAGLVVNVASASATEPDGAPITADSNEVSIPAVLTRTIETIKTTPTVSYAAVGEVIDYAITVRNTGNVTMSFVVVTDPNADAGSISCDLSVIAPTDLVTCSATHTVTQADLDAGQVLNIATGQGTPPIGPSVTDPSDQVRVPAVQTPAIMTVKSSITPPFSAVGDVIDYTIDVTNTGNVTVTGVVVTDPNADAGSILCSAVDLAPSGVLSCSAQHTVTQVDIDAGEVLNVATARGTDPTGAVTSDLSDQVRIAGVQTPGLSTAKSSTAVSFAAVGEVIDYTITVTNIGNVTMTSVAVVDPVADGGVVTCVPTTLAPSEVATCTAAHTIVQADIDRGLVANTAVASAVDPKGIRTDDPSNEVVTPAVQSPSITTIKSSGTADVRAVGDVIDYSMVVRNSGNVTLTALTVADAIADAGSISCARTTLAPAEETSCTATHTVTQVDLDAGIVSNVATGSALPPIGARISDPSNEVVVPVVQSASIEVQKSTTTVNYAAVGDVIVYSITVTNTGNVTVHGLTVADPRADVTSVACPLDTLAPGESTTCPAVHTVTQADLDAGQVVNVAEGTATPPIGSPITDQSPPVSVPAVASPSLTTTKSSPTVSFTAVGDQITYVIEVLNTGNVTLREIAVADPRTDAAPVCPTGPLPPGQTATCSATHTVTQADLDAGVVINTAVGSGRPPSGAPVSDSSDAVSVPAVVTPSVATTKSTTTTTFAAVGDVIDYSVTVRNTGNVTLTGVTVADPVADAGSITCDVASLAPTETATCTATHTVVQADLDRGFVLNTATGSGTPPAGAAVSDSSNEVTVDATKVSGIETLKSSPTVSYAAIGDVVNYEITVRNAGNVTVSNMAISDPVADAGSITCDVSTLAPGATATCTANHTVTQADLDTGEIINVATGSAEEPGAIVVTDPSNEVRVPATQTPSVITTKSSPTTEFDAVGDVIDYTVTVRNSGNVTLDQVVVDDPTADAGTATCPTGPLAPWATAACTATHTVTQADLDAGSVTNVAVGRATPPIGGPVADPSAEVVVPGRARPAITTTKSSPTVDFDAVGDVIAYDITVTNDGNVTVRNVEVTDVQADGGRAACTPLVLAPAATATCTAAHTVTQADIDAGRVTNTAVGSGLGADGTAVIDFSGPVVVPAVVRPAISTTKSSTAPPFSAVGQLVAYRIEVRNTGNVTVHGLQVDDPKGDAGSMLCDATELAPGDAASCTVNHSVTQADLDAGGIDNVATAVAVAPDATTTQDPSDTVTVPAVQRPAIETLKSSPTLSYAAVGEVIDYAITVRNIGNVTLSAVAVSDPNADVGSIVCDVANLAPGERATCAATHTVTQSDLDAGVVNNVATGSGVPPSGPAVSALSNPVSVSATKLSGIETLKSTAATTYAAVGDAISYAITVRNAGNVTVHDLVVTDPMADGGAVACAPTTLAPTEVATCAAAHTVTQADLDTGEIVNVATAEAVEPDGTTVNDPSNSVIVRATLDPELTTTKTGSTATFAHVGETIGYTITVTNTGNLTATGVAVTDPRADAGSIVCDTDTLVPAGVATCSATHTVTQADVDTGAVVNTAGASGRGPTGEPIGSTSNPVTTPAVQTPGIETRKSAAEASFAVLGSQIHYEITVHNTGNVTLTAVSVADEVADAGSISCNATTLAPAGVATCSATHTVTQADLDGGRVTNVATGSGLPPTAGRIGDPSPEVIVPAGQNPAIAVDKASPTVTFAQPGDQIDYTIVVTNTGNVTLHDLVVTDPVADPESIFCPTTTLAPGERTVCTAHHVVKQADIDRGEVVNVATASATSPAATKVTIPSAPVIVPATQTPSLITTKTTSTTSFTQVGEVITYDIAVANTGNVTLADPQVSDANADAAPVCPVAPLLPGATAHCAAAHTVTQADLDRGSVFNVATGSAVPPTGPAISDPSDGVTVSAAQAPAVQTTKSTATTSFDAVGDVITYAISVRNTGNVTLTGVAVVDPVADAGSLSCSPTTLVPGATSQCTAVHTVTQADLDFGVVLNTATGSATPPSGAAVSDPSDEVRVEAVKTSGIETLKSSLTTTYRAVGDIIEYTITVRNAGNVTLSKVVVADPQADAGTISCDVATLAPAAVATCSARHTVTQADLDAGQVANTATASATEPGGTVVTDPSNTVLVTATQTPALTTTKSSSTDSFSRVGDTIAYTLIVHNTGNVTLRNLSVADPRADGGAATCPAGPLAPGDAATCTAVHTVTQDDLDAGEVINVAHGRAEPPIGAPITDSSGPVTVQAATTAAVETIKSTTTISVSAVGDVISYGITVRNTGNVTVTGLVVADPVADGGLATCSPTAIAPGQSSTCTAARTVSQADLDRGFVRNVATATGQAANGAPINTPSNEVIVPGVSTPSIETAKSSPADPFSQVGELVTYRVTVRNTGNVTVHDVAVVDPVADAGSVHCDVTELAPGDQAECSAAHTVTQADLDAGAIRNVATATALPPSGPAVADPSNPVTISAAQTPAVSVTKSTPTTRFAAVGDVIDYVISVTNVGNVTLTEVAITDPKADAGSISCAAATLAPGASTSCMATHTVTQLDLDAGGVNNVATGTGRPPAGPAVSSSSNTVTVAAIVLSGIETLKSTATPSYDAVGDVIDYTITVRNAGNVSVTGVTVTDPVADLGSITCTPVDLAPGAIANCSAVHTVTQADLDHGLVRNIASASSTAAGGTPTSDPSNEVITPAVMRPGLTTEKSSVVTDFDQVGDVLSYSIVVTNTGNVTVNDLAVDDPQADGGVVTCDATILAPATRATCQAKHTVTQADLDVGAVVNTASSSGRDPRGVFVGGASNSVTIPARQAPALTTTKSAQESTVVRAGEVIHYEVVVTNTGNVTLADVGITDPIADAGTISCAPTVVAPGAAARCVAVHTVTQADIDAGSVVNVATGSGRAPAGGRVSTTSNEVVVTAEAHPSIEVAKTSSTVQFEAIGDVIGYVITARNTGNVTISEVTVTDTAADAGSIVCSATRLAPGELATCTALHTVTQADFDAGGVRNVATVDGRSPTAPLASSPTNEVWVPANQQPALETTKTTSTTMYNIVGQVIAYVVTVRNIGNVTLDHVDASDGRADVAELACTPRTLAPGERATCPATITVTQADLDASTIVNTATGRAEPPSGPPVNGASNAVSIPSASGPAIEATKSATTSNYDSVGDVVEFMITVRNAGNLTINKVVVTDANADAGSVSCPTGALAPGATAECTARHTVTQADLEAERLINVATATAVAANGLPLTAATNRVEVPAIVRPALTLVKDGKLNDTDGNKLADLGESIDYVIVATNTGNVIIPSVVVSDPMLASMTCTPSASTSLAPGATMRCTRTHVVVAADIANALVVNTATVSGQRGAATFKIAANKVIAATPGSGGKIPVTGSDVAGPLAVGAACLGVGALALIVGKRRRRRQP